MTLNKYSLSLQTLRLKFGKYSSITKKNYKIDSLILITKNIKSRIYD